MLFAYRVLLDLRVLQETRDLLVRLEPQVNRDFLVQLVHLDQLVQLVLVKLEIRVRLGLLDLWAPLAILDRKVLTDL